MLTIGALHFAPLVGLNILKHLMSGVNRLQVLSKSYAI